ncbi:Lysophospholipase D GDPD1, partial [Schistosoma japonicum]
FISRRNATNTVLYITKNTFITLTLISFTNIPTISLNVWSLNKLCIIYFSLPSNYSLNSNVKVEGSVMLGVIATLLATYSLTSYILLRQPTILHRKKRFPFKASHISHRGGSGEKIENTLEAFSSMRIIYLKGENGRKLLALFIRLCSFCNDESSPSCKIARLEDLFDKFPNTPVNIDIKVHNDFLINEVARLIETHSRERITVWGSMNSKVSKECKLRNKNILTFAPFSYVIWIMACYFIGLLPFLPVKYDCFELPLVSVIRSNEFARQRRWDRFLPNVALLFSEYLLSSPLFIKHLRKRGIPVFFWVCNNEDDMLKAFELGASGVMTDYPKQLAEFLKKHPEFPIEL